MKRRREDLRVVETETWDNGKTVTWLECPIPYGGRCPLRHDSDPRDEVTVPLSSIRATQKRVTLEGLEKHAASPSPDLPVVVETEEGERFIADGHHRLTCAWLAGKTRVQIKRVRVDERVHAAQRKLDANNEEVRKETAAGKVLAQFPNAEDGVTGLVVKARSGRFHACLRDDDSGEVVGVVSIYDDLNEAKRTAQKWANA